MASEGMFVNFNELLFHSVKKITQVEERGN